MYCSCLEVPVLFALTLGGLDCVIILRDPIMTANLFTSEKSYTEIEFNDETVKLIPLHLRFVYAPQEIMKEPIPCRLINRYVIDMQKNRIILL